MNPIDKPGKDSHKVEPNQGSNNFNQGAEQDPDYDKGTPVSDEEKKTGHLPDPGKPKDDPNKRKNGNE